MTEFRYAKCGDAGMIPDFIRRLADYENMAAIAAEQGCGRLERSCLDWNQPSIDFYLSMGAIPMDEWTNYRLTGERFRKAAE